MVAFDRQHHTRRRHVQGVGQFSHVPFAIVRRSLLGATTPAAPYVDLEDAIQIVAKTADAFPDHESLPSFRCSRLTRHAKTRPVFFRRWSGHTVRSLAKRRAFVGNELSTLIALRLRIVCPPMQHYSALVISQPYLENCATLCSLPCSGRHRNIRFLDQ